ncbi:Protein kinase of the Mitotic Exit Network, partial [Spiromyces aspiralis]
MSSTAKLAADPGSYALEFQPEELYGQLRAEQLHRDYVTACQFIEDTVKQKVSVNTLHTKLQDGIVLCEVLNKLRPGIVKHINYKDLPFAKMENISHFLAAANKLGLKSTDLFQTVDLYEAKNMNKVVSTILTIARVVAGVPFSARRKDSDDAEANKLDSVRRCPAVVQDYHHSYHQSLVQATLIDLRPQSAGVGKDASLFIKGLLTPDASISAHGSKRKGTVPSFLPPVPGQDLASPDTTSSTLRQQRRQNNTATVRTINVAKRIVRNETPVPTGSTDSSVPKNAKPPGTDTSSSHNAYYDPPMSPPLPTLRVSAFDIFKDPPANALAAVDSDLESASKMSD